MPEAETHGTEGQTGGTATTDEVTDLDKGGLAFRPLPQAAARQVFSFDVVRAQLVQAEPPHVGELHLQLPACSAVFSALGSACPS